MNNNNIQKEIKGHDSYSIARFSGKTLALLFRKYLGNVSISEFAVEKGISRSLISRIVNNRLVTQPSKRIILKIIDGEEDPHNGVFKNELLNAAGYDSDVEDTNSNEENKLLSSLFSESQTMGLSLFLDNYLRISHKPKFDIEYNTGYWIIKNDNEKSIIGIPAFCNSVFAERICIYIISVLISCINRYSSEEADFYIFTDNIKLYDLIKKYLYNLKDKSSYRISIMITKDYKSFYSQCISENTNKEGVIEMHGEMLNFT